jgi:hypothetical protein
MRVCVCQSTGSFFRDRSTTLGTLIGVSFADDEQGQGQDQEGQQDAGEERQAPQEAGEGWRWRRKWRRRRWRSSGGGWWRLCRNDIRVPTSPAHFLDRERRLSGAGLLCAGGSGGERAVVTAASSPLLEDGRAAGVAGEERWKWKLRRLVLLTAICSGGAG